MRDVRVRDVWPRQWGGERCLELGEGHQVEACVGGRWWALCSVSSLHCLQHPSIMGLQSPQLNSVPGTWWISQGVGFTWTHRQPASSRVFSSLVTFDLCAWCQPLTTNFNNLSSASLEPTDPKENKGHKRHSLYIWLRARTFLGPLFPFFFYSGVCVAFLTKVSVSMALRGFPGRIQKVAFSPF